MLFAVISMLFQGLVQAEGTTKHVSINDLKAAAPQVWQQSYINKFGVDVPVNTVVEIPTATSFPVLCVSEGNQDVGRKIQSGYSLSHDGQETLVTYSNAPAGSFMVFRNAPDGIWNERGEKVNKPEWKNAFTQSIYWLPPRQQERAYANQNSITLQEVESFFQSSIDRITNSSAQFSLDLLTTKCIYHVESWKGQKPTLGSAIGQGYYSLSYTQDLLGIPVLGNASIIGGDDKYTGKVPPCPLAGSAEMTMASVDEYMIAARMNEPSETTHTDVPLCSYETVKAVIESLIDKGHLRSLSSMRLGFVLFPDPNNEPKGIAFPTWVIKGDWYEKPSDKTPWYHEFTPNKDGYIGYHAMYATEIMINAQTGEIMRGFTKAEQFHCPTILTWDAVGK